MTRPRDIADSINRINSSAADATAVTIDSSEQVGIGTSSPNSYYSKELVVAHGTEGGITLVGAAGTATGYLMFADGTTGNEAYRGYVGYSHSTPDVMVFGTSGAERLRILSGGGISFNGDTATANALDDYEEGTFTPTYEFSGGGGSFSYSIQSGVYTKIGRQVFVQVRIRGQKSGTGSGALQIRNLPFTPTQVSNVMGTGAIAFTNNFVSAPRGAYVELNTRITLTKTGSSTNTRSDLDATLGNGDVDTSGTTSNDLIVTVTYTV
jgi:hypothetical protein